MTSYHRRYFSPSTESDAQSSDEIKVLITGFGPFRSKYPRNPSSLIARSLPPTITLTHSPSPSTPNPSTAAPKSTTIRLIPYPEEIRVSFKTVRELIPAVYSSPSFPGYNVLYAQCSYIVHIGMAATTDEYTVERQGHRDGYYVYEGKRVEVRDVDGKTLSECEEEMGLEEGEYWRECPKVLQTTLDVDDVLERMHQPGPDGMSQLPDGVAVEASDDAGNYLCDFIYYSSLSHFWRKNDGEHGERPVVFLHVPPESDEEVLQKGREVTKALIRAVVASGRNWNEHHAKPLNYPGTSSQQRKRNRSARKCGTSSLMNSSHSAWGPWFNPSAPPATSDPIAETVALHTKPRSDNEKWERLLIHGPTNASPGVALE